MVDAVSAVRGFVVAIHIACFTILVLDSTNHGTVGGILEDQRLVSLAMARGTSQNLIFKSFMYGLTQPAIVAGGRLANRECMSGISGLLDLQCLISSITHWQARY